MLDPTVGIRREIGVLREIALGCDQRRNLHEEAVLAQQQMQRKRLFRQVKLDLGEELLTRRGGTEIEHAEQAIGSTYAAQHRFVFTLSAFGGKGDPWRPSSGHTQVRRPPYQDAG